MLDAANEGDNVSSSVVVGCDDRFNPGDCAADVFVAVVPNRRPRRSPVVPRSIGPPLDELPPNPRSRFCCAKRYKKMILIN